MNGVEFRPIVEQYTRTNPITAVDIPASYAIQNTSN